MKIITDASPLIGLARIERLDILYHLFDSVIPKKPQNASIH